MEIEKMPLLKRVMYKSAILLLTPLLAAGCTGMKMDVKKLQVEAHKNDRVEADYKNRLRLIPITASLLVEQARADLKKSVAKRGLVKKEVVLPFLYRVGPQDILQVTVWDHPELTTPAGQFRDATASGNLVRQDGTVFYPYIGVVSVDGLSVEEIRRLLTERLAQYIENPQVDVRVAAFRSQKVYVTGEVMQPGMQPITSIPLTVLEAIQQAGGGRNTLTGDISSSVDLAHVKLTRKGKSYTIDVQTMLLDGDLSQNILLRNGDLLHIPENSDNKVFVMGEVKKPISLLLRNGELSLAEALGESGGVNMGTSNPSQVYVIRAGSMLLSSKGGFSANYQPSIFHLNAHSPAALILANEFVLQPHDVVFVATAEIVRWGRVLDQLRGAMQSITVIRAMTR